MSDYYDSKPCNRCGQHIYFERMKNGRWKPVDPHTGYDHWPTCTGWEAKLSPDEQARFDHCVYGKD